ncbi:MAG: hypothetical protein HeimC3_02520 [Candidatus Heimdallarchaeota archaeon LC_3]|nr:MAG: hypothetical protein HeimC3_02520 [Candidatus Heimdallarchaeota archaeon LC_3]
MESVALFSKAKIFSFKLFKRYFFLALVFQVLLGMILISGVLIGGEFYRSKSYETFFKGDRRNYEFQTLGSPYAKMVVTWDYEYKNSENFNFNNNILQNILNIPSIGYYELNINLYESSGPGLLFFIQSPEVYRQENINNPENATITESAKNYLETNNKSLNPDDFPFLSKPVFPVVTFDTNQVDMVSLSTDYINLSQIFNFNHSVTLFIWYSAPDHRFKSSTELNLYIQQINDDIESNINLFLLPVQINIKNPIFISQEQYIFSLLEDWYLLKIIDKFFQYLWFYFLLIFVCTFLILLILLKNQSNHLALLLIRGMKLKELTSRILINIIFGLLLGNIIFFIALIFLPDSLTFVPISNIASTLLISQLIFSLTLIFSFIVLMRIFSSYYVNPEEEPIIQRDENIFQIAKIKYKSIFNKAFSYSIKVPKTFYILLISNFMLLLIIHLAYFFLLIPFNAFFTITNLLFVFLGFQLLVLNFLFFENFLFFMVFTKKDLYWINSFSQILRKLQSNRQLILIAFLSFTLVFQVGTAINNFKRDNIYSDLQKSGDIAFTPSSEEINNQIYQNLSGMDHVISYYSIFKFNSNINENTSNIKSELTIITNETSFYSMRPYVEGVLDHKITWETFLLQTEGVILYKDLSLNHGLKIGDFITISIPTLSLYFSSPILSIYYAGIDPLYTGIIVTESLVKKQLELAGFAQSSFENALINNNWLEESFYDLNQRYFYLSIDNDTNINSVANNLHELYRLHYDKTEFKDFGDLRIITEKQWLPIEYKTYEDFFLIEMFPLLIGMGSTLFLLFLVIFISFRSIIRDNKTYLNLLTLRGISHFSIRNFLVGIQFVKFFLVLLGSIMVSFGLISLLQSQNYFGQSYRLQVSKGIIPQFSIFTLKDWVVVLVILGVFALMSSIIQLYVIMKNKFEPLLDSAM